MSGVGRMFKDLWWPVVRGITTILESNFTIYLRIC
jgi:hypothetical protein